MVNLSAVLFVLGMTGLALVVGLHQREEDAWQRAANAAFLEQKEAIDSLNGPKPSGSGSYHHIDNRKYIGELGGCIFVLILATIVRYHSPRPTRTIEPVRVTERWLQTPASRQPVPSPRAASQRRGRSAPVQSHAELADRLSAVVWGDRVARKETT